MMVSVMTGKGEKCTKEFILKFYTEDEYADAEAELSSSRNEK